jgi:opacity protein-like surface antigen
VRDAISTTKDNVSAFVRYRATQNLTLRAEYSLDDLKRDFLPGSWALDPEVKKNTFRLGGTYRFTSRFMLRGDYTHMTADVPANSVDNTYPSKSDGLRALLTWNPSAWFNLMLSGGTVREERSPTGAPFAGDRTTDRNRAMGTMTFLMGKKTSLTPGYAYFQNKSTGPIVYTDLAGATTSEDGVPYADTAHVVSLSLAHAISDVMTLTADVSQSHARGNWRNSGVVAGSAGIAELTDLKVVENEAGADLSLQYTKNLGTDFRYSYRKIDNKIDDALDGTNQIVLATLTYKW